MARDSLSIEEIDKPATSGGGRDLVRWDPDWVPPDFPEPTRELVERVAVGLRGLAE
ncbi:hypothetical protein ACIRQP_10640 [Streptomyces sp. NPDC102274]|uniref:hypothetical protein n=1 Tax=Streptomyces sp. NPDC102274 TaxID=3366151 RepID=UPI003810E063